MPIDWRPWTTLVSDAQSFVLTSHMRPDCDAIGSEIALATALRSRGKTVRIINGDPVPPHIAFARAEYAAPNLSFEEADCAALPAADASIDLAVAFEVIEHIEDDAEALRLWREHLRPGGWVMLSTPPFQSRFGALD